VNAITFLCSKDVLTGVAEIPLSKEVGERLGYNCPQGSVFKSPDLNTNTGALQRIGFDPDFD